MAADFSPELGAYKSLKPFVFWAQATLPTVFDDSLSYYESVSKLTKMINTLLENVDTSEKNIERLAQAYDELQGYVNAYFDNLDVQNEINNKLDSLAQDGTLSNLIEPFLPDIVASQLGDVVDDQIGDVVADQIDDVVEEQLPDQFTLGANGSARISEWLAANITQPTDPVIDPTLSIEGAAADAAATGTAIANESFARERLQANLFDVPISNGARNTILNVNTGAVTEDTESGYSTYNFSIIGGKQVLFYGRSFTEVTGTGYAFYDKNGAYISGGEYNIVNNYELVGAPANAYTCTSCYKMPGSSDIRANCYIAVVSNIQEIIDYINDVKKNIPAPVIVDPTLSVSGEAADAKITGIKISNLENTVLATTENLFCLSKENPPEIYTSYHGVKITPYEDGSVEIDGTPDIGLSLYVGDLPRTGSGATAAWLPAGTYSFGIEIVSGTVSTERNGSLTIRAGSTSNVVAGYLNREGHATFESTVMCYINFTKDYVYDKLRFKIMINEGETLLPFVPRYVGYDIVARNAANNNAKELEKYESVKYLFNMPEIPVQIYSRSNKCQGGTMIGDMFVLLRNNSSTVAWSGYDIKKKTASNGMVPTPTGFTNTVDALGHCNDIAYNPTTGKAYVCTMFTDHPIAILNVAVTDGVPSFTFEGFIDTIDGNGNIVVSSGVAYDRTNDCYYIFEEVSGTKGGNIYKYGNTWSYIGVVQINSSVQTAVRQGIDTDGTYLYCTKCDNTGNVILPCIQKYNLADGALVGERAFYLLQRQENEGIAYDWERNIFIMDSNVKSPFPLGTVLYLVDPDGTEEHVNSKLNFLF